MTLGKLRIIFHNYFLFFILSNLFISTFFLRLFFPIYFLVFNFILYRLFTLCSLHLISICAVHDICTIILRALKNKMYALKDYYFDTLHMQIYQTLQLLLYIITFQIFVDFLMSLN